MRNYFVIGVLANMLACQSHSTEQSSTSGSSKKATTLPDTFCFRQILSRDTTTLQLVINGDRVTGYLDNNPYEKDRAKGPFEGTMRENQIQVDWQRSGEGTTQPYALNLLRQGDRISWPEGERVEQQGKWVLKDLKAVYTYTLDKIDCIATPSR